MNTNSNTNPMTKIVLAVLAVWLAVIALCAARGLLVQTPGAPPIPIVLAVTIPIAVFLGAYRWSKKFREFVATFDLRVAVMMQAWRFAGFGFLALYANHVLPGLFALPAGVGDALVGITAPLTLCRLVQRPGFAASKSFISWNLFGMLDLIVAVSMGGLTSMLPSNITGGVTMGPITQLPLALVPGFLVPLFVMLHLTALIQSRRQAAMSTVNVR